MRVPLDKLAWATRAESEGVIRIRRLGRNAEGEREVFAIPPAEGG